MRLTQKLALGVVLLVGIPVFLLGHLLSRTAADIAEQQTADHLLSVNRLKQSEFERWLADNEQRLELLAQRPLIRDSLRMLVQQHRDARSDVARWAVHEQEHLRLLNDHLHPYISEGGFERVSLLDPESGEVLLSTDRMTEGMVREFEEYFIGGQVETTTQNPYYSITQSRVTMTTATPVLSRTGELVAVLAGDLDLHEASAILSQGWDISDSEDTYIVNLAGRFVTTPRFGGGFPLMSSAETVGVQRALSGETGLTTYQDYRGASVLGAYMWIPARNLAILTEIDKAKAIHHVSSIQRTLIGASSLVGVVAIALGIALARGLVKPAELLVEATEHVGQGDLDYRVRVTSRDEIGKLGHAFNAMAENLKNTTTSIDKLNREVEARTVAEVKLNRTIDALEQSESMFRMLTDSSPVGIFIIDGTKLRYTNPAFEEMFGYAREDLIHRLGLMDITHPDDHEAAREYIGRCFAGVRSLPPHPFIGVQKDGSRIYCEAMARPVEYQGEVALLGSMVDVTERMKTHDELQLKNTVFESSIAANSTADLDGIITHANAAFLTLWGYNAKQDVVGRPLSDFLAREDEAVTMIDALNETGEWEGDVIGLRKDGTTFISSGHATVILDESGNRLGYQSANLDVTEQRHAQEEIRRSKEVTDSIIDSLPGVFYQISADSRFVRWNSTFEIVTGYTGDEIALMSPLDLFEDHDKEKIEQAIATVFVTGAADVTAGFRHKDGRAIPYYFTGMRKDLGGIPYLIGMGTDITSLREAEAAVRKSEEKYRTLVETTSDWLWETDEHIVYTYASPRSRDLLGYEPDEVIGRTPFEFMPAESRTDVQIALEKIVASRQPFTGRESVHVHKDGHLVVLETSGRPILDEMGKLIGYRGIDRDITERKVAEKKLSALLEELQRSNTELEQFAYVASHDLQEPLRMVASYTQLLERRYHDALDDDAREFIAYAVDGANRMQRLINDLLAFSRIQTRGRAFTRVDLNAVLGQSRANLAKAIDDAAAVVTNDELPTVLADEAQLTSVFQNLISNALKFHSGHAPRIHVGVRDSRRFWDISVADNGIGISADFFDRIFVIFQRLHTRDEYPGTGIGLALCKRIVERHGGRIWVESTVGEGTTIHFTMAKSTKEVG